MGWSEAIWVVKTITNSIRGSAGSTVTLDILQAQINNLQTMLNGVATTVQTIANQTAPAPEQELNE